MNTDRELSSQALEMTVSQFSLLFLPLLKADKLFILREPAFSQSRVLRGFECHISLVSFNVERLAVLVYCLSWCWHFLVVWENCFGEVPHSEFVLSFPWIRSILKMFGQTTTKLVCISQCISLSGT